MAENLNVESIIGSGLIVKGDISSKGTLRVDGKVEGSISANGSVVIGENGVVKANITADHIIVGGTVRGNVTAREKVQIILKGRLHGDVQTQPGKLIIADGAVFEGGCTMGRSEEKEKTSPKTEQQTKDAAS